MFAQCRTFQPQDSAWSQAQRVEEGASEGSNVQARMLPTAKMAGAIAQVIPMYPESHYYQNGRGYGPDLDIGSQSEPRAPKRCPSCSDDYTLRAISSRAEVARIWHIIQSLAGPNCAVSDCQTFESPVYDGRRDDGLCTNAKLERLGHSCARGPDSAWASVAFKCKWAKACDTDVARDSSSI
ncbi:hypothetical protein BV25DRAFT_1840310 [Artomyces pyxidatus]|uniref:Uncharacterized protein n=1 Tax=Artomyces pyxidatus TaxID=48021 RepID=A0ACB8SSG8_9AGAM|nr:hypothetical protein BV25DRAFT_1840310 [Artomyces pyxidatus]